MEFVRRNFAILLVALVSFGLGGVVLLTVFRVGQEKPVAPTAPESKPRAVEGSPVPSCTLTFQISLPSPSSSPSPTPTPTPSPTPSPTPTPRPTPSPTPTPTPTPSPTPSPSPTPTPTPVPECEDIRVCKFDTDTQACDPNVVLTSLQPGNIVHISVAGTQIGATNGRIRIWGLTAVSNQYVLLSDQGGDGWLEACSDTTDPYDQSTCNIEAGRYYVVFTLLAGYRGYRFESEIFYPGAGWR